MYYAFQHVDFDLTVRKEMDSLWETKIHITQDGVQINDTLETIEVVS